MYDFKLMDVSIFSPLCVDLDGTLIKSDVLCIAWKQLLKKNVLHAITILFAFRFGYIGKTVGLFHYLWFYYFCSFDSQVLSFDANKY